MQSETKLTENINWKINPKLTLKSNIQNNS